MNTPGSPTWTAPRTRNPAANSVLPHPAPPQTSVGRPCGKPPPVISSRPWMPVGHLGKRVPGETALSPFFFIQKFRFASGSAQGVPARAAVRQRNLREDGGAFPRCGIDGDVAADHLEPFSHAEQTQSPVLIGAQHLFQLKALAVVFDRHANGAPEFLNPHFRLTGLRMAGRIVQRLLGPAVEHGAFVTVDLFNRAK